MRREKRYFRKLARRSATCSDRSYRRMATHYLEHGKYKLFKQTYQYGNYDELENHYEEPQEVG